MTANYMFPPPPAFMTSTLQRNGKSSNERGQTTQTTGLNGKDEAVQVATLLTVDGEEAHEVFTTYSGWASEDERSDLYQKHSTTPKCTVREVPFQSSHAGARRDV